MIDEIKLAGLFRKHSKGNLAGARLADEFAGEVMKPPHCPLCDDSGVLSSWTNSGRTDSPCCCGHKPALLAAVRMELG